MEELIRNSEFFKEISDSRLDVEIWDDEYIEDGWAYWNVVSRNSGVVKKLAYLRIKESTIQKRSYDEQGDDLWSVVQ
ncbi:hypothetical protein MSP8886_02014 [Marinomonas spartinae]|uniref:Uncharacterized protein n=1 Tax=Marinomonas spartinae TaxID=1792290 RepID=A0A1A8TGP4_9GAMM|nr:hypothetical protein [Marinomonas spartinae]SBS31185.1 hypothetical protein MSP8886_02014 [Marinomonas spartinae]